MASRFVVDLSDEQLTYLAIGCFRRVYNRWGFGFLESGYIGALCVEFKRCGLRVRREVPVPLYYDGILVAKYRIDLLWKTADY